MNIEELEQVVKAMIEVAEAASVQAIVVARFASVEDVPNVSARWTALSNAGAADLLLSVASHAVGACQCSVCQTVAWRVEEARRRFVGDLEAAIASALQCAGGGAEA